MKARPGKSGNGGRHVRVGGSALIVRRENFCSYKTG